jgi:hypothetical protein
MAEPETNNHEEPTFPTKRKPDQEETHHLPNKTPKITTPTTVDQESNLIDAELPTTVNSSSDAVPNNEPENNTDDDDDEDDDEDENSDEEPVVDRKGKGIMRDDKGKGKMIEEEDEDDDDSHDSDDSDDDSDGNVSGSDSDFSDDPLAEVDLDNILPSRTRRRTAQTGVHISGGTPNAD